MTQEQALEILKSGRNVFLTGEPGAGKTYTIGMFIEWLEKEHKDYVITASTGIAASHINGKTIHSWSGLGIRRDLNKDQLEGIKYNRWVVDKIKGTEVLVIDEISMLDAVTLQDVNNILQSVLDNKLPFGGVQVVLVGDFFQLPPVSKGSEQKLFAFESQAWLDAEPVVCYLTEQHRQSDQEFLDILSAMRMGTVEESHKERLIACQMNEKPDTQLFTHNADVEALNNAELAKLEGKEHSYKMIEGGNPKLVSFLKRQCLSPENLVLKEGAIVMFTRNHFKKGYVNGSIGKVIKFQNGDPVVKLQDGLVVTPDMAEWTFTEKKEVKAYIRQLPLRLAWAITVHKSQGMSLDSAAIDLSKTFEYGQGYVAISRVRSLQGLHLSGINEKVFEMHPKVVEQDAKFRSLGI